MDAGEILNNILTNKKAVMNKILSNVGCHPEEVVVKYTNICMILPANTTSKLQPLVLELLRILKHVVVNFLYI